MTRISLVIPTHDDSRFLEDAVGSVDEREPVEVVIVDDGSDDPDALDVLEALRRAGWTVVRRANGGPLEATFDHGEEGYGLWLDPAVADNPVYAEHWAGHRPVEVTIDEDQIVIRRAGAADED